MPFMHASYAMGGDGKTLPGNGKPAPKKELQKDNKPKKKKWKS